MAKIVNTVCKKTSSKPKNTGSKKQCIEGTLKTYALGKEDFSFPSQAVAETELAWKAAKKSKNIVPFYDIETITDSSTKSEVQKTRYSAFKSKSGVSSITIVHNLAVCSHEALASYESSEYNRFFGITDAGELICEVQDDGSVKGLPISSFLPEKRTFASVGAQPETAIEITFEDYVTSVLDPAFALSKMEGILDVQLELVTPTTATSIKFKVIEGCSGSAKKSIVVADLILTTGAGIAHPKTFVPADANGVYELTGTGFANEFILGLNGVIEKTEEMFEAENVIISGI
jgi:hypothetical protein